MMEQSDPPEKSENPEKPKEEEIDPNKIIQALTQTPQGQAMTKQAEHLSHLLS